MKIKNYFSLLLLGAVSSFFASCSDDKNNNSEKVDINALSQTIDEYVSSVVYPTYTNLAKAADALYNKSVAMQNNFKSGSLSDADVKAACQEFENARYYWERSEAFLYGAASDFDIDPHIDSWPLDQTQMASFLSNKDMVAGLNSADPIAFVRKNNAEFDTALGFHGVEFILYRNGAARPASAFSKPEDYETFAGTNVGGAEELAFLVAVTGDLRDHCWQLEVSWLGNSAAANHISRVKELGMDYICESTGLSYGESLLNAGKNDLYPSLQYAVANILTGGCSNICAEVADQKMGQAYRVLTGTGSAEDAGDYIESPYSKHSFIDYQGNIYSIRASLYGIANDSASPTTNSIINYLRINNYERASQLDEALKSAISALQACIDSKVAFVDDPGNPRVSTAIDAVTTLDEELNYAANWVERL